MTLGLCFKTSLRAEPFISIEFDLHENEPVGGTHFHMNDFVRRLVLTQRQKTFGIDLFLLVLFIQNFAPEYNLHI